MPRTQIHEHGSALSSSIPFRLFMGLDICLLIGLLALSCWRGVTGSSPLPWFPWATVLFALLSVGAAVRSLALWAAALVWRRRLSLVAVVAVLWRGSPVETPAWQVAVVIYTTILWIVLLLESKRVALAVAEATGEEVYQADPTRRGD